MLRSILPIIVLFFMVTDARSDTASVGVSGQLCVPDSQNIIGFSFDNRGIINNDTSTGDVSCPVAFDYGISAKTYVVIDVVTVFAYTPPAGGTWTCSFYYKTPTGTTYTTTNTVKTFAANTWSTWTLDGIPFP